MVDKRIIWGMGASGAIVLVILLFFSGLIPQGGLEITYKVNAIGGIEHLDEHIGIDVQGKDTKFKIKQSKAFSLDGPKQQLIVEPQAHPIKSIEFTEGSGTVLIDDTPESGEFVEVYAIDPTGADFTQAEVKVEAKGNTLLKCKDWNFSEQYCFGEWVPIQNIKQGENYTILLTPEDPGFAELNSSENEFIIPGGQTTEDVTIGAVNLSRTFVHCKTRNNQNGGTEPDVFSATCGFVNETTIRATRYVSDDPITMTYQVVESENIVVQNGTTSLGSGDLTASTAISPVDINRSFILFSQRADSGATGNIERLYHTGHFNTNASINFTRSQSGDASTIEWFVVEFQDDTSVQSDEAGPWNIDVDGTSFTDTISSPVNTSNTWLVYNYRVDTQGLSRTSVRGQISNATEVLFQKDGSSDETPDPLINLRWYAIEFPQGIQSRVQTGTASTSSNNDDILDVPILEVNLTNAFSYFGHATSTGSGNAYPRPFWTNLFTNETNLRLQRGYFGQAADIDWQVIEWPTKLRGAYFNASEVFGGSQERSVGNISVNATLEANGNATNIQVACVSGNCSTISDNWVDGSSLLNGGTQDVTFACDNSTVGIFQATYQVSSDDNVRADEVIVNCEMLSNVNVQWNQTFFDFGSSGAGLGNVSAVLNITSNGVNTNITVSCEGDCSQIVSNFSDGINLSDLENALTEITCLDNATGTFNANFSLLSSQDFIPDTLETTCQMLDITPPLSVTNLQNVSSGRTHIFWNWTNPSDDFDHVEIYLNGTFQENVTVNFYNATGLLPDSIYEIATRTVDVVGNINTSWVNDTGGTDFNAEPQVFLLAPQNNTIHEINFGVNISAQTQDNESDELCLTIYGDNETPPESIIYQECGLQNNTVQYNWTAPVRKDTTAIECLYHFDNRSEFGENDTTVNDFGLACNDAVCSGTSCPTVNVSGGKFGGARYFDGVNDFLDLGATSVFDSAFTDKTVEVWYKVDDASIATPQVIYDEGGTTNGLNMYIQDNRAWVGAWCENCGSGWNGTWLNATTTSGEWHYLAYIFQGSSNFTIVHDNFTYTEDIPEAMNSHTGDNIIGENGDGKFPTGDDGGGENYAGYIDEFVVYWETAVPIEELLANYEFKAGERLYWKANVSDTLETRESEIRQFDIVFDAQAPVVNLTSPPNATVTTDINISFICDVSDNKNISNISFYWNYSGTFQQDGVVAGNGTSQTAIFNKTDILQGDYIWNCLADDGSGNTAFAESNFTITQNASIFWTPDKTLSLGTTTQNATDLLGIKNITAEGSHTTPIVFCEEGDCTEIITNFSSTPVYNQTVEVYFTCLTDQVGEFTANYSVFSTIDTSRDILSVNCSIATDFFPNVTGLVPTAGSVFSQLENITIGANVTDDVGVSAVLANISYPNGTVVSVELNNSAGDFYNASYMLPALDGSYEVRFIANDTLDQINSSQATTFTVSSDVAPNITSLTLNTTSRWNNTDDNLTLQREAFDIQLDEFVNITSWYVNSSPYTLLNLPFEGGGSNNTFAKDYSGNRYNGSVVNAILNTTGGDDGFGAYELDGDGDYIDVGDVILDGQTSFTISLWYQLDLLSRDNTLVSKGSFAAAEPILVWRDDVAFNSGRTDTISALIYDGSTSLRIEGATGIANDNDWHHVVVTYQAGDADGLRLYFDGVEDANSPLSSVGVGAIQNNADGLRFGAATPTSTTKDMDGSLDNIQIFDDVLSSEQIALLYARDVETIVSEQTQLGDTWQACAVANDRTFESGEVCTNNVTIVNVEPPLIIDVQPAPATVFNTTQNVTIQANITDNDDIDQVLANITLPNGSTTQSPLSLVSGDIFALNYSLPPLLGNYSVSLFANDTIGNSALESTFFELQDTVAPDIDDVSPSIGTSFNTFDEVFIGANISDSFGVDTVLANLSYPNGTLVHYTLNLSLPNQYNTTFTIPNLLGQYNVTFFANDTNGLSSTAFTFFTTDPDNASPSVTNLTPINGSVFNTSDDIEVGAIVTDNIAVLQVEANITYPNGTLETVSLSNSAGDTYNTSLTVPKNLGTYTITIVASDSNGNINGSEQTSFVAVDQVAPIIQDVEPANGTTLDFFSTVDISTNVTDNFFIDLVLANLTYPNGTNMVLVLNNTAGDIYATTMLVPPQNGTFQITFLANDTQGNMAFPQTVFFNASVVNSPVITSLILNATTAFNATEDNLTYYLEIQDADSTDIKNISSWSVNGSEISPFILPFEGGSSNTETKNYGGLAVNATVVNAAWNNTQGMDGFGTYTLDGDGDYLDLGDNVIDSQTEFSFTIWIKVNDTDKDNTLFSKGSFAATEPILVWRDDDGATSGRTNTISFLVYDGSTEVRIEGADGAVNDNEWHFIAGTYTSGVAEGLRLFIDGVEDANSPLSTVGVGALPDNANSLRIGAPTPIDNTKDFDGLIDDVAFYNRALTPEQISALYQNNTRTIVAEETDKGDVWQVCVTGNDRKSDGDEVCSNNVVIDALAPTIANVDSINITNESALILWDTNEPANSSVQYGTAQAALTSEIGEDNSVLSHAVNLSGLLPNTTYFYNVTSCDSSGNCQTEGINNFTTFGVYQRTITVASPNGTVNASLAFTDEQGIVVYNQTAANHQVNLYLQTYNVSVIPQGHVIEWLTLTDAKIEVDTSEIVGIDDTPETGNNSVFESIYAINPTISEFTNLTAQITAQQPALYKCSAWNFSTQECAPCTSLNQTDNQCGWHRIQLLSIGQTYTISLNATDPGFGEGNVTDTYFAAEGGNTGAGQTGAGYLPAGAFQHVRGFIKFNISGIVPQGYNVTSAILNVTVNNGNQDGGSKEIVVTRSTADAAIDETTPDFTEGSLADFSNNVSSGMRDWINNEVFSFNVTNLTALDTTDGFATFILFDADNDPFFGDATPGVNDFVSFQDDLSLNPPTLQIEFADITPPNVTLITPGEGAFNSTANPINMTFQCLAQDAINLTNVSFYITNNLNTSFQINQTTAVAGQTNLSTYIAQLENGNYTWNCQAADTAGNIAFGINRTLLINFTAADNIPPSIFNETAFPITDTTATITWITDETANSSVFYGITNTTLNLSAHGASFVINHSILLSGLTPSTVYFYNVSSCDPQGNCNTTGVFNFTTQATPQAPGQVGTAHRVELSASPDTVEPQETLLIGADIFVNGEYEAFENNVSSVVLTILKLFNATNVAIINQTPMAFLQQGTWFYEFNVGDNMTGTYLAIADVVMNTSANESIFDSKTFFVHGRPGLTVKGISADLVNTVQTTRLSAEVKEHGIAIPPAQIQNPTLTIIALNGSAENYNTSSGLMVANGEIFLDYQFNLSGVYLLNWSASYLSQRRNAKELIAAVSFDEKLANVSIDSDIEAIIQENRESLIDLLQEMEEQGEFTQEEIFLVTDSIQTMDSISELLSSGQIGEDEAAKRFAALQGRLHQQIGGQITGMQTLRKEKLEEGVSTVSIVSVVGILVLLILVMVSVRYVPYHSFVDFSRFTKRKIGEYNQKREEQKIIQERKERHSQFVPHDPKPYTANRKRKSVSSRVKVDIAEKKAHHSQFMPKKKSKAAKHIRKGAELVNQFAGIVHHETQSLLRKHKKIGKSKHVLNEIKKAYKDGSQPEETVEDNASTEGKKEN